MNHASENAMDQLIIDTMKQQCPDVRLIYLFGSRVGNLAREDSDWDIAILCARPLDQIQRWQLGETMAQKLHQDVDLVDLATASTVLRMEILQHGRVLFDTPPSADEFAMTTISMYQHLQSERADILADFYQRMTPSTMCYSTRPPLSSAACNG